MIAISGTSAYQCIHEKLSACWASVRRGKYTYFSVAFATATGATSNRGPGMNIQAKNLGQWQVVSVYSQNMNWCTITGSLAPVARDTKGSDWEKS